MDDIPDETAIALAAQGDHDAFGVLYNRYIRAIYNYIYYRTGNSHDAEDLTEKVFFRAFGHIHNFRDMGVPISAWLYRIAHNLVANWHRDKNRRQEVSLDDHAELHARTEQPETAMLSGQANDVLYQAIRNLTPDRQQLLILKFVEHLSNAEIAYIMGRSEGAIKSLYHRTLLVLRDNLIETDLG